MIEEPQTIVKSRKTPQDELSDPASDPSLAGVVIVGPFLSNPHTESSERFEGKGGEVGGAGAQGSFETTASEESHGSAPEETDHDDGRDSGGDTGESDDE